jgi:pimeloyl-ACP methyl ester carboxylesterase
VDAEQAAQRGIEVSRPRLGGIRTCLRRTAGEGTPTVLVHGNPTSSADWMPFLRALDGPAVAFDLPAFGRAERPPPERFNATMGAYADYVDAALADLGIGELNLVVHDWGVVGLIAAQRWPERVRRLVVCGAVPLLPGYRWHWVARIWRRPPYGELLNRAVSRPAIALLLRLARPRLRPMPAQVVDTIWEDWDRGTADAVLRLYRSADPEALAQAGAGLGRIGCPSLILWGRSDPYIGVEMARAYAARLPSAELAVLDGAGHWPWIDRPEAVGMVRSFLASEPTGQGSLP